MLVEVKQTASSHSLNEINPVSESDVLAGARLEQLFERLQQNDGNEGFKVYKFKVIVSPGCPEPCAQGLWVALRNFSAR